MQPLGEGVAEDRGEGWREGRLPPPFLLTKLLKKHIILYPLNMVLDCSSKTVGDDEHDAKVWSRKKIFNSRDYHENYFRK